MAKCDVSHAKCSGISLGRNIVPTIDDDKAYPHRIKNNTIHDCGQTGIIGVEGNPSPIIEHNSIYNINVRQNLVSDDVSAINLSPAIGAKILRNCIHDCTRGIWLGDKVEDTQISRNVFYNNSLPDSFEVTNENREDLVAALGEDIEIKNSMGVTLIDKNFLLSDCALKLESKGVLLVHNLINGSVEWLSNTNVVENDPYYHRLYQQNVPESAPYDSSCFYNNVFIRKNLRSEMAKLMAFAHKQASEQPIDNHSDDNAAYVGLVSGQRSYIPANKAGNIFMNDEQEDVKVAIDSNEDGVFLDSNIYDYLNEDTSRVIAVGVTPKTARDFDTDFLGNHREGISVTAGPFDTKEEYSRRLFRLLF
ncbi:right-handed parallel beta-helix repeat-containing protein [Limosilactobacillus reuteri]|uniref:right-handed parallel beta-helix repeat-containing protein n=1 Tax=Limosilactobacillus reuteri TaxID=1598 RepID=UPI00298D39F1|nr:right-handed parallel beta-helix repeat-containing protein [Limosilactobacillus reuteri]